MLALVPAPALNRINDKLIHPFAVDNFVAGADDGIGLIRRKTQRIPVGDCGSFLDSGHIDDKSRMHVKTGNLEILAGPLCLYAVIGILRYIHISYGIFFCSCIHHDKSSPFCHKAAAFVCRLKYALFPTV